MTKSSKNYKVEYIKDGGIIEHIRGHQRLGNCALCGGFCVMDPHHKVTKSRGGGEDDLVDVCRSCHEWIGNYPLQASKLGLYLRGYKTKKGNGVL